MPGSVSIDRSSSRLQVTCSCFCHVSVEQTLDAAAVPTLLSSVQNRAAGPCAGPPLRVSRFVRADCGNFGLKLCAGRGRQPLCKERSAPLQGRPSWSSCQVSREMTGLSKGLRGIQMTRPCEGPPCSTAPCLSDPTALPLVRSQWLLAHREVPSSPACVHGGLRPLTTRLLPHLRALLGPLPCPMSQAHLQEESWPLRLTSASSFTGGSLH